VSDDAGAVLHCDQCPFLHQVSSAKRNFAFISGSAWATTSKRAFRRDRRALPENDPGSAGKQHRQTFIFPAFRDML